MPLPIVSGSEVSTPSSGNKIDGSAFRQAALAPGRLAQSIGENVGGLFEEVSQKIQANRNAQQVFKADLSMRQTKDDFTAQLVKMPDPGTWLPAWKQQVDQKRQQILNDPHAGPEVKRHLNQMFDTWEQATTSEIKIQALRQGVANTYKDAVADSTYAAHQGDIEGAQNILKAAVENHAMSASEANKIGKRFPTIAAQSKADMAIATDPINAPELIKQFEKDMEPRIFIGVLAKAREAMHAKQSENLNEFAEQMDISPDGTIDPRQLAAAVKEKRITQRGADGLVARMEKKNLKEAKEDFSVGMMEAQDHDWVEDKSREETAREMKDNLSHLPAALRIRAYNHIDRLKNDAVKKGEKEERPIEAQVLSQMRHDREHEGLFFPSSPLGEGETQYGHLQGGLKVLEKMKEGEVKDLYGVSKEKVIEAEKLHYAQTQQKMREWFRMSQNKDATIEEANAYRMQLEQPFVHEAAKASLNGQPGAGELANLLKKYGQ